MEPCATDLDCPDSQLCYEKASDLFNNTFFCDCDFYRGWEGPSCTDLNPVYAVFFAWDGVLDVMMLVLLSFAIAIDFRRLLSVKDWFSVTTLTWGFLALTYCFFAIGNLMIVVAFFTPEGYRSVVKRDEFGTPHKLDKRVDDSNYPAALFYFFGFLTYTTISLNWIENAKKVQSLSFFLQSREMIFFRRAIYGSTIFLSIITIAFAALNQIAVSLGIHLLMGIFLIGYTYVVGYKRFISALAKANANYKMFYAYTLVRQTVRITAFALTGYMLGNLIIIITIFGKIEKSTGLIQFIGFQILTTFALMGLVAIHKYVHETIKGRAKFLKNDFDTLPETVDLTQEQTINAAKLDVSITEDETGHSL